MYKLQIAALLIAALSTQLATAQDAEIKAVEISIEPTDTSKCGDKPQKTVSLGTNGITFSVNEKDALKKESRIKWSIGVLDLGLNTLIDKTEYHLPDSLVQVQNFVGIENDKINESLFDLRNAKSWNVNIYPVMIGLNTVSRERFKLWFSGAVGLQIYNFRFKNNLSFTREIPERITMDTIAFTKNKLAIQYLSVPLMAHFQHRVADDFWLSYGIGAMGGYRLSAWGKQVSGERGKEKHKGLTNFNDFNFNLTGEIGINGWIKFFGSYQVTSIYKNNLMLQYPLSFGIRIGGI